MNEDEREKTIQKLVLPLKSIHHTDVKPINSWSSKIKNEVKNKAIEYKSLFNQEDYLLILESLKLYDICLSDNHFAYLHNNLQFNNIIYNNGSLKLIDFKDALVAPIDFEFRKLLARLSQNICTCIFYGFQNFDFLRELYYNIIINIRRKI